MTIRRLLLIPALAFLLAVQGCTWRGYWAGSAAATPVFAPPGGLYASLQTVTITDATPGAAIYYTTNGTLPTVMSTPYTNPISVSGTETIDAIAVATGFSNSAVASATYTIALPAAAAPVFSPVQGVYPSPVSVTISDSTPGATIYYTIDGTLPTMASPSYSGPIIAFVTETFRAIAVAPGYGNSPVSLSTYSLMAATPTFSPPAGTYGSTQTVGISDATAGATIYYTTDGTTPTTLSSVYFGPIKVSVTETVQAIAVAAGYTNSLVGTARYVIQIPQAATPVFSPPAGTYTSQQMVTIMDATPGASIYVTTDGSTPTISSGIYTGAITVPVSQVLEAIAVAPGYTNSAVATAAYVIQAISEPCPNSTPGVICTIAGDGLGGYNGDGGSALGREVNGVESVRADSAGNIYIADTGNNRIRKVTSAGIISTVAGTGVAGYGGDGGPATSAMLNFPVDIAFDANGNMYITDQSNNRIRKVTAAGIISTVAGTGTFGYTGDGGSAVNAELWQPFVIGIDATGQVYFSDQPGTPDGDVVVRRIDASGVITTVAGNGQPGGSGDGGPATSATFSDISELAFDAAGNLYISDNLTNRIRMVNANGVISTVAGTGTAGYSGDGGPATSAELNEPTGVDIDPNGNMYISEGVNARVRMVNPAGIITTVAGTGLIGYSGDGGPATLAGLASPTDVKVDLQGNFYISDLDIQRIRKVNATATMRPTFTPPEGTYGSAQSVSMASATAGAAIFYTLDGSTPTVASTRYTGPVAVSAAGTIKAIAVAPGYTTSTVATATYVIGAPGVVATPTFSPPPGPTPVVLR